MNYFFSKKKAGQIAKIWSNENKVIGIVGSQEKSEWITNQLNFDLGVIYKQEGWEKQLERYLIETNQKENSVDVYFDNVGGNVSEKILPLMDLRSTIILCGQIASYEETDAYPPPISRNSQFIINSRCIKRDRYLVLNYSDKLGEAVRDLVGWYLDGKLVIKETRTNGIESIPSSFVSVMNGGKKIKKLLFFSYHFIYF